MSEVITHEIVTQSSNKLASDGSSLPTLNIDEVQIWKDLTDEEILKQRAVLGKIADVIAVSNEETKKKWLVDIRRAIETSIAHFQSYYVSFCLEDVDQAVIACSNALKLATENLDFSGMESDGLLLLVNEQPCIFAHALSVRFRHMKLLDDIELEDIEISITIYRDISTFDLSDTPEKNRVLYMLGWALMAKYELTHELHDIDEAIAIMQGLADTEQDEHDNGHESAYALCFLLLFILIDRSEQALSHDDIHRAILIYQKEIVKHPNNATMRYLLGNIYKHYFLRTKDLSYIDMAIETLRETLYMISESHGTPLICCQLMLAKSLVSRYYETRDFEDLQEAIALLRRITETCGDDDPELVTNYKILGSLYYMHYTLTSNPHDLRSSTTAYKEAFNRASTGNSDLPDIIAKLGILLSEGDSPEDIYEAACLHRRAVDITTCDGIADPKYLGLLGMSLLKKYDFSGDKADLDEGVDILCKSVTLCPPNNPALTQNLLQLAFSLERHFGRESVKTMPLKAIDDAISVMDVDDKEFSNLHMLGKILILRYKVTGYTDDKERAISFFRDATLTSNFAPFLRFTFGKLWGSLCATQDRNEALEIYKLIFDDIIPQVVWVGHKVEQRYIWLTLLEDFVCKAASAAGNCMNYELALRWLEQGRSIVWHQVNQFRMPFDDLRRINPVLCQGVEQTSCSLNELSMQMSQPLEERRMFNISVQGNRQRLQHLAKKWDSLLGQVRGIPGFEYFLRYNPTSIYSNLRPLLPRDGFVVMVNVQTQSSDLIIFSGFMQDSLQGCRILRFDYKRAVSLRETLHNILYNHDLRMRTTRAGRLACQRKNLLSIKDILSELWYRIVKPVITMIGLKPSSNNPPRIWWCPTGPLAFLPLHAAGDYSIDAPPGSNVMDYAISSYTPTFTSLAQGLSKYRQQQEFKGLLAVSEPKAPNLPWIPNTTQEIRNVQNIFQSTSETFKCKEGENATANDVLHDMSMYSWIHLSCHAMQHESPLKSAFYLHDGPLTLRDIMQRPLPDAQFAYLSACETGKGDKKLSEEAVHLAGGMLAAGYTSVVATMWSITDDYAPDVAKDFYAHILQTNEDSVDQDSYRNLSIIAEKYDAMANGSTRDADEIIKSMQLEGKNVRLEYKDSWLKMQDSVKLLVQSLEDEDGSSLSSMENKEPKIYPNCTRAAASLHHAIGRLRASVGNDEEGLLLWVPFFHVGI